MRGATTSVEAVNPDVAIVLESDIAGDVPGIKPEESAVKLGKGPTLVLYDARMIPNLQLRDLVMDTARELGISAADSPPSKAAPPTARRSTCTRPACPTVVLGVPARHIHSHSAHHPPRRLRRRPEARHRRPAQARRRHRHRLDRLRIPA